MSGIFILAFIAACELYCMLLLTACRNKVGRSESFDELAGRTPLGHWGTNVVGAFVLMSEFGFVV